MSGPLGSSQWMYATDAGFYGYSIDQSLRFNDNDSARLTFTPSSNGTSRKTYTISLWFKRGNLSTAYPTLIGANVSSGRDDAIRFGSGSGGDELYIFFDEAAKAIRTNRVFRDISSWYHLVLEVDTTQATDSDRVKLYINGVQETSFASATYPAQNYEGGFSRAGEHSIGRRPQGNYFDGYIAEVNFIDGTALDADSFGETKNGVWVPKEYSGSYGNNGFYLSFADSSAIGDDLSGNTNDFTATNLAASDVVLDSPTNNFATWNPLHTNGGTLSEGNLKYVQGNNLVAATMATPTTGKWYWELNNISTNDQNFNVSIIRDNKYVVNAYADGVAYNAVNGNSHIDNTTASYGATYTTGDIIGVAVDLDSNPQTVTFYKNNASQGALNLPSYDGGWVAQTQSGTSALSRTVIINFGQDSTFAGNETAGGNADDNGVGDFFYAPPSGHLALCTANLPEPTIGPNSDTTSDENFNIALYQSNGGLNTITGLGHQPDFLWIKQRDSTNSHAFTDSVRGPTKALSSNSTESEYTYSNGLQSFDSDGFTLNGSNGWYNSTTVRNYVAWSWKAGGTAVSNTDGSITSSVSANPDAGCSICTWTGNGTSGATIGHGLSSAPELIFSKRRDSTGMWTTYAKPAASDAETDYLRLDGTDTLADDSRIWNDTAPTASVFSVGSGTSHINTSSATHVTYCFHSVEGYSKVGSFEGNSSASDGPFVYTGFAPSFVMGKAIDQTGRWWMYDSARSPRMNYAIGTGIRLEADDNGTESADSNANAIQFLSNGFKVNSSNGEWNASGSTYIYLAFAEAPFKYSNAR